MSQLLARTSMSNIINSAQYEKVKYHKFCTVRTFKYRKFFLVRKTKMSQLLPCTKHLNIINSAQYEKFKYHKFYLVRKRKILQIPLRTENQNKTNSTSYEKSKISQILPNTRVINSGICHCTAKWNDAISALHGKVTY